MKYCLSLLMIFVLLSCQDKQKAVTNIMSGNALGTSYGIKYITQKKVSYQKELDSLFDVMNMSMSTYLPISDISKINGGDTSVVIDHMFQDVFKLSRRVYNETNGAFDPTVGVLANAWGFGPERQIDLDSTKVDSLLKYVGFTKVKLNGNNTISKTNSKIRFDFNAIAKGYTIDRIAVLLKAKGVDDFLIELGGELIAHGRNTIAGKDWIVGIDDPNQEDKRKLSAKMTLKNSALASSGNYRKFRIDEKSGEKYVHTIDPKTGFTRNSNVLGVSVLAASCAEADALATSFMVMTLENTKAYLMSHGTVDALIIYVDEDGALTRFVTPKFKTFLIE